MIRKIVDNLGYVGALGVLGGAVHYSLNGIWDGWTRAAVYGGLGLLVVYCVFYAPTLVRFLGSTRGRRGGMAGATLLLTIGILALLNFLNYRHHERVDLSEGQLNSLSPQSLQICQNLDKEIQLLGFFERRAAGREFEDLAMEYRFASPLVSYEVIDPQKQPGRVEEYKIERDGQIIVRSGDRSQKVNLWTEQDLTSAIIRVTRDRVKAVYFLEGHGERGIEDTDEAGLFSLKNAIERQNYAVRTVNLAVEGAVPTEASVVIAAGPASDFLPNEIESLDEFIAGGGRLLLLLDPSDRVRMETFLAEYGIALGDETVVDASGLGQLLGLGPAAPLVNAYSKHPITDKLDVTTFFPMARPVRTTEDDVGFRRSVLFSSSGRSWAESDLAQGEEVQFDPANDDKGPVPLAMVATRSIVEGVGADEKEIGESRVMVIGDSDFVSNQYLEVGGGNLDLILNSISWMADDEDLVAVRPKAPTSRQITLTQRDTAILWWATVILLPLATAIIGLGVWYQRR